MKKSILIAGATALSIGILQSMSLALAHGHGGGHHGGGHHGGGHHGGGHHGGGHHGGGGHHHHGGWGYNDGFWGGAAVGGLLGYGMANTLGSDPCADPNYRMDYPGYCIGY